VNPPWIVSFRGHRLITAVCPAVSRAARGLAGAVGPDDAAWFQTGDLAVVHPDSYIEVRDRSKDIIISGRPGAPARTGPPAPAKGEAAAGRGPRRITPRVHLLVSEGGNAHARLRR
jgi:hypothetical protein